jgi:hypothetical protein
MNNPLDTDSFKHYLIFTSLGRTELYQIAEPVGFDGANFVKEQEGKRYARTREYGAIDKLTFVDCETIDIGVEQVINPQGDVSTLLNHGLQWLLSIYNDYGFEAKVEYILEKNGVQFSGGVLDFTEKDLTDGYTYITCKLIQKNKVANFKRRFDGKFNLFGTKNALQEDITPMAYQDLLLKGLIIKQNSVWDSPGVMDSILIAADLNTPDTRRYTFNNCKNIIKDEIKSTLTFLADFNNPSDVNINNFKYLKATKEFFDVEVKISNFSWEQYVEASEIGGDGYVRTKFVISWGVDAIAPIGQIVVFEHTLSDGQSGTYTIDQTFNIPYMPAGTYLFIYMDVYCRMSGTFGGMIQLQSTVEKYDIEITLNQKSLDRIISASRWIDIIKQSSLYSCGIPINAPLFEVGGAHYNNMAFNRAMISKQVNTFSITPKIAFESLEEINCDYEPDENEIFIGSQDNFYTNDEIGVFDILADDSFNISENDRHQINRISYKYKTFEQDRLSENTDIAIHTEAEFSIQNESVENVKEINVDQTRDELSIQKVIDLEIDTPTTSTDEDDKVYMTEVVDLPDGSYNQFGIVLLMRIVDGKLEILNKTSEDDPEQIFAWTSLGINIGTTFLILDGENVGSYTVFSLTSFVLTLTPDVGTTPTFSGDGFISIKYYYQNVLYTSRTDEDFISNPLKLQNVAYSIKRNLEKYGSYLKSCLLYSKKDIINTYFKSNGAFSSQLDTEVLPLVENATILYDSLPNPLITSKIYNITTVAEFQDVLDYMEAYKTSRGFVRCLDSNGRVLKGYVQKLDHLWAENKLKLVLEEKFETQYLMLTYDDGLLTVNDAQYNLSGVEHWWRFDNDLIKLYDEKNRPLCNYYKYNLVNLNGYTFESKEQLLIALLAL